MTIPAPEEYVGRIQEEGFVGATAETLKPVLENTARIEGLEAAIGELTKRVAALEKKPK